VSNDSPGERKRQLFVMKKTSDMKRAGNAGLKFYRLQMKEGCWGPINSPGKIFPLDCTGIIIVFKYMNSMNLIRPDERIHKQWHFHICADGAHIRKCPVFS
jgi:hypothetical protein